MDNTEMNIEPETVPYIVYESSMARADRRFRLMWGLLILMLVALIGTNAGWIIYENQFEDIVMTENTQDGEGVNIIGGGDVHYGSEANDSKNTP